MPPRRASRPPNLPLKKAAISSLRLIATSKDDEHIQTGTLNRKRKACEIMWENDGIYDEGSYGDDGIPGAICKYCKGRQTELHVESCCAQSSLDRQMKESSVKFDPLIYKEAVCLAIIRHGYPFSFVEDEANRELHSFLSSEYTPICRKTAKNHVMEIHEREKTRLREFLCKIPGKICLTCDVLTSIWGQEFLSLTAHFVDAEWNLHAKILNICVVPPPVTAVELHDTLLPLLREWGIQKKVFMVTLDSARCGDNLQEMLADSLSMQSSLPCGDEYFHVHCGADLFSLMVQEGLKVIDEEVRKIRNLVSYLDGTDRRTLSFRVYAIAAGIDCSQSLFLDCPTSWTSTYKMIDSAIAYRVVFSNMKRRSGSNFPPHPTEEEWARVSKISALLKPFNDITACLSANLYLKSVWRIGFLLLSYLTSEDESLRDMAKRMKVKFDKYWDSYSSILSFAAMLDPRFKYQFVVHCFQKLDPGSAEIKARSVKDQFYKLFKEYVKHNVEQSKIVHPSSIDEFEGFSDFDDSLTIESQLDKYLGECKLDHMQDLDVLQWWKVNGMRYPRVADMARDILAIPIVTAASESPFSMGRRILTNRRHFLCRETSEALLATRSWLFGFDGGEEENLEIDGLEIQVQGREISQGDGKMKA